MKARTRCDCHDEESPKTGEALLHGEIQDTTTDAWKRLLDLVEEAAAGKIEKFAPGRALGWEDWQSLVTLPASIGKLKHVRELDLYGSSLVRLPPEIGEMSSLEDFTPYTSYRLHWFPYEIIRCAHLTKSCVSTRALYGNYKLRHPFPNLRSFANTNALELARPRVCGVCQGPFAEQGSQLRRISLRVATDIIPLLVYACSDACVAALPAPPENYVGRPHTGGRLLEQPSAAY
ncbi:leucine-rich repeat domain-containing protein [Zavarzinella formosa]|uniref:hypothetical protein n=1 Tax=Zavarzinella formosa TaxID=360055 RepID=UPI0002FF6D7C|nr:hypothetical protein [Zavarzinella formosa]